MSRYLVDRIEAEARIIVLRNTKIVALEGDRSLAAVRVRGGGGAGTLPCVALFSFVGADPVSERLSGWRISPSLMSTVHDTERHA
jgi:thioredoxin reductase (NADPH)